MKKLFLTALLLPLVFSGFFLQPEKAKAGSNTTTIKANYHSWTDSGYPTYSHYNGQPYMNTSYWSSDGRKLRSWVHFDLSSIPAGATITSASFNIWLQQDTDETDCYGMPINRGLVVGQVSDVWGSSMNWNNQPGYYSPSVYDLTHFPCDGNERFYYISATQIVKNWVESGQANNGFVILADEQGTSWSRRFTSSTGSEIEKPQLYVMYTTPDAPVDNGTPAAQPGTTTGNSSNTGTSATTSVIPTVNPNLKKTDTSIAPPTLSYLTIAGTKSDAPLAADLPIIIGDSLVVGGKATKEQTISLAIGDKAYSGEVNADGNWEITIDTSTFVAGLVKAKAQAQNLKTNKGSKEAELFGLQVSEKKIVAETPAEIAKSPEKMTLKNWLILGGLALGLILAILTAIFRKKLFKVFRQS